MEKKSGPAPMPPTWDEYNLRTALDGAQDELVNLMRERERMEWRINKLQNDIVHLAALCHVEVEDPLRQLGLTDAVRYILGSEKKPLSVQQIVDALNKSYYKDDVSEYKNLPANVHTIVRRLIKANEVQAFVEPPLGYGGPPVISPVRERELPGRFIWIGGLPPMPPPPGWLKERMKKPDAATSMSSDINRLVTEVVKK